MLSREQVSDFSLQTESHVHPPHTGFATWHMIAPEFPPQPGGVGHYTALLSEALRHCGDEVHIWCPAHSDAVTDDPFVHRSKGHLTPGDLIRLDVELDLHHGPRNILVQWVPHGFGYRSMNVPFCLWLLHRSKRRGDRVQLMVHEAFLWFGEGSWKQDAAAAVHRLMILIVLRAAKRIWVSVPRWAQELKPYLPARALPVEWLPVVNNIPVLEGCETSNLRTKYAPQGELIVGHFGTHGLPVTRLLDRIMPALSRCSIPFRFLLLGVGSKEYAEKLNSECPELSSRVSATGLLEANDLSCHLQVCSLMIQPYEDGVSTRRGSLMASIAHARPVVTTSGKATESLWAASGAISLVPVEDPDCFVRATEILLRDELLRQSRSIAAKNLYEERFDISHTVRKLRASL